MARQPRVHYPGALYHVILRGNGGQTIFFDDKDRKRFYFLAKRGDVVKLFKKPCL
jgi:putative transposase